MSTPTDPGASPPPTPGSQPVVVLTRKSIRRAAMVIVGVLVVAGIGIGAFFAGRSSSPTSAALGPTAAHHKHGGNRKPAAKVAPITTTTTTPPTTTSTSTVPPTTTSTAPAQSGILAPATTPPVVDECSLPITTSTDGNASPLFCPDGGINVQAWNFYVNEGFSQLLGLGPSASEGMVIQTMCADYQGIPRGESAASLAASYYGWSFTSDPAYTQWPYYPNINSNECGS